MTQNQLSQIHRMLFDLRVGPFSAPSWASGWTSALIGAISALSLQLRRGERRSFSLWRSSSCARRAALARVTQTWRLARRARRRRRFWKAVSAASADMLETEDDEEAEGFFDNTDIRKGVVTCMKI